jgi:hypothetical protein
VIRVVFSAHELPAPMLQLKVETRGQAVGWAERYDRIMVDGEIELGKTEAGGRSPKQKAELPSEDEVIATSRRYAECLGGRWRSTCAAWTRRPS